MKRLCLVLLMILSIVVSGCAGSGGGGQQTPTDLTAVWAEMKNLNDMVINLGIGQLKTQVDALTANNPLLKAALDKQIADANAQYISTDSKITDVKSALALLQTQLNSTIASMATQSDISALQAQINTAFANITNNSSDITALKTQIDSAIATATTNSADIATLKTQIVTALAGSGSADTTALQTQITAVLASTTANSTDISTLKTQMLSTIASATANSTDISTLKTQILSVLASITTNSTDISTLQTQIAAANANITANSTDITTLQTQISAANANIATNTSNVSTLQTQIASAIADITSNTSNITTLQTQVTAIQLSITGLQDSDTATAAQIAALNTNIATLQTTITNLQTQITALSNGMVKITTAVVGGGTISPPQYWPKNVGGASVVVTPNAGYYFAGATGCSGSSNAYVFTANALLTDCTLTATFLTSPVYYYASQFGTSGSGAGQFGFQIGGLAVDTTGNIYVDDNGNNRIEKFDSTGNFLLAFGASGNADGQFSSASGIATDASNNVYVADRGNNRIQKFNSSGSYLMKFGSAGAGDGQFSVLWSTTVDSAGNIYTVELGSGGNNRVQKFNSAGTFVMKISSFVLNGVPNQAFSSANGVAVDSNNNIYISSGGNGPASLIFKYDSAGTYLATLGTTGSGDGQLSGITSIVIKNDKLYVLESTRVQVLDLSGNYIAKYMLPSGTIDKPLAVDSSENLYIFDWSAYHVDKIAH